MRIISFVAAIRRAPTIGAPPISTTTHARASIGETTSTAPSTIAASTGGRVASIYSRRSTPHPPKRGDERRAHED